MIHITRRQRTPECSIRQTDVLREQNENDDDGEAKAGGEQKPARMAFRIESAGHPTPLCPMTKTSTQSQYAQHCQYMFW